MMRINKFNTKTIGTYCIVVSTLVLFVLLFRFYNQGGTEGISRGIFYSYYLQLEDWVMIILYSFLVILSGILIIKNKNNIGWNSLIVISVGIIMDRIYYFSTVDIFFVSYWVDTIIPILISISFIWLGRQFIVKKRMKMILYISLINIPLIILLKYITANSSPFI